jgi:hypothetical protein
MPQAKSGGSRSRSGAKSSSGGSTTKRSAASSSSGGSRASSGSGTRRSSGRTRSSSSTSRSGSAQTKSAANAAEARLEAAAQRLRKLNERIIEAGKGAGETTLTSYEKALKTIASTLERGPGSSDVEWISNLATAQAKFIRDVTTAWTSAARDMLK